MDYSGKRRVISVETHVGRPIVAGERTLTPRSQVWSIRLPFARFVWNRPLDVIVEQDEGDYALPIFDPTRLILILLLFVPLVMAIWQFSRASNTTSRRTR